MSKQARRDGVFERSDRCGWYISFVDSDGIRRKQKVEAHTRKQAADALSAVKTKVQTEKILGVRHLSEISTADLLLRYKRFQKTRVKASTFDRLECTLKTLNAYLPQSLKKITKASVGDFISARSQMVAPGSVVKEVATLKHALRCACDWNLIHTNPADRAKLPRLPLGRTRYLSPAELRTVLDKAPAWMRAPIMLAAATGMRRGELLALRWRDVDLDRRIAYLHETKNGDLRALPLNDLAMNVLRSLSPGEPAAAVLAGVDASRLSVYTRRVFKACGIEDASFHSLRHTAGSWLVMAGVDLYAVGQVLGHKTPRMTARYAHLSPSYMAGAVGRLDAVFAGVLPAENPGTLRGLSDVQASTNRNKAFLPSSTAQVIH